MVTNTRRQTLRKTERLYEKKAIEALFEKGESFNVPPVKILWKKYDGAAQPAVKAAFTVPRKTFKRAVDRNLLKRRMREAYRRNKYIATDFAVSKKQHYHLIFVYIGKGKALYSEIESKIVLTLQRLASETGGK